MNTQASIAFLFESFLIRKAAAAQKLELNKEPKKNTGSLVFTSKPVGIFPLDAQFIAALEKDGFTWGPGTRPPYDMMIYLSGESDQHGAEIFESDSWAWKKSQEGERYLTVYFSLFAMETMRGLACKPKVWGNCSGGACHEPTIRKVVAVIAKHFAKVDPLIPEALENKEGLAIIPWTAINLGGVKSVTLLFFEHFGRREKIVNLAQSTQSPFDPNPLALRGMGQHDREFVVKEEQQALFDRWKKQLKNYRASLA